MRVTMPRFILAEFNTHRVFSRNAGSSRAIPISRRIQQVRDNPFIPISFDKNQKGMQSGEPIADQLKAREQWLRAADYACEVAEIFSEMGVHKQFANRVLEPYSWVTVIVSSTMWDNFFKLRISPLAQPEIKKVAEWMFEAISRSTPMPLWWGQWHIPLADDPWVAVGRIARVSYETDPKSDEEEIVLGKRLMNDNHWSPFEHIAMADKDNVGCRNFVRGWRQWRSELD
jgi:thymidylate synthase ThyX